MCAGIVGCDGGGSVSYNLTIASTGGGSVGSPGERTFTYVEGTVVNLVATADEDCEFQGWSADTEGVADPGAPDTTIILNEDSSITANFAPAGSHGPSTP